MTRTSIDKGMIAIMKSYEIIMICLKRLQWKLTLHEKYNLRFLHKHFESVCCCWSQCGEQGFFVWHEWWWRMPLILWEMKDFVEVKRISSKWNWDNQRWKSSVKDYVHGLLYLRFTLIKLEKLVWAKNDLALVRLWHW
jgi:hypothetical protein